MLKANRIALDRLMSADPVLVDVKPAYEVLEGLTPTTFLHAGPPIEFKDMCPPMQGAVYCALLNEGLAKDIDEAKKWLPTAALPISHVMSSEPSVP